MERSRERRQKLGVPPITGMKSVPRSVSVLPAGKAPRMRFRPGEFVEVGGQFYEIVYAYRTKAAPHEWLYCLEERKFLRSIEPDDKLGNVLARLGCGQNTPRVVYEIFVHDLDAYEFFGDIPSNGDRITLTTKQMLAEAKVVSSGEVLDPESLVPAKREEKKR